MPDYAWVRLSIEQLDSDWQERCGDHLAIDMRLELPPEFEGAEPAFTDRFLGYFLPFGQQTHISEDLAAECGFDGSSSLMLSVLSATHAHLILVPAEQVIVNPRLPMGFLRIGCDIVFKYFEMNRDDLPEALAPLPAVVRMTARDRNRCRELPAPPEPARLD